MSSTHTSDFSKCIDLLEKSAVEISHHKQIPLSAVHYFMPAGATIEEISALLAERGWKRHGLLSIFTKDHV
jgi:hypothetical protein